ncbi:efflux RND transporter permease subunit [Halomonas sp. MCCC 1A17488]|uniref:efflux RND transporter permease subunit n=1 Tax=unclassified Halomonas TaxID=2609666 RepID=UPI0018D24B37|nr:MULTISPECIES: efflux RND transporter permease subunit [unclassified Halomonas]MCE8018165.1 efflux RND transporter permease subunit [Halomonas sp. MCCC 1A17488]MCG3241498.1 efflux RND transporter permease subunit [Halomonas sp. MCCC 1A17488]QPP48545.1 efflux RND transporter permease subunit [Halomonas sp. SS10-MC5]
MRTLIEAALDRSRTTLLLLLALLLSGLAAWQAVPKEANPDVPIPMIYVSLSLEGVSPEDGERLLVRPMEQELRTIEGVRKMTAQASEGHAAITLEFDAGFDARQALADVRERVDIANAELPEEADEPRVVEVNVGLFPVLTLGLSGPIEETRRLAIARQLQDAIEGLPEVLEVEIGGESEELMEIVVDPLVLDSYGVDFTDLFNLITRNNRLVAAGSLDTGAGRSPVKVPGVIETLEDIFEMPVKVDGDRVVTFADVGWIHPTFKDPEGYARIDDEPALVLEISKRAGANLIATIEGVRDIFAEAAPLLPEELSITTIMDQSVTVEQMLSELLNNVLTAVALVLIVILAAMGVRSALMVGLTIPGAFLTGILLIWAIGYTLNIVVLFALILVAGMLVDGAIVVSELADRHLREGQPPHQAWVNAATRMSWPVIAATATTLAVFFPLLFWPGVVGEFMKYLPATVILCLLASLAMALIFLPTLGGVFSTRTARPQRSEELVTAGGRLYRAILARLLAHPGTTLAIALLLMALIFVGYGRFNHGVEFFPAVEPDSAQVVIRARGDFSTAEKDAIVRRVEARLAGMSEVQALYARSYGVANEQIGGDVIGVVQFQLIDWQQRRPARTIMNEMAERTDDLPGVVLEFREQDMGPGAGKPIVLEISAQQEAAGEAAVEAIRAQMERLGGFRDIEDNRSLPGIEWRLNVDRAAAARMGADVAAVGSAVQLVTTGLQVATYRPAYARDEVDIRVRLPESWRSLDQLERLTLNTPRGQVPISHFASLEPAPKVDTLHRIDGQRAITLEADVAEGFQPDERLRTLLESLGPPPEGVRVNVAGEQEDQEQASRFLITAFLVAIALMLLILVTQFNSLYQALLVLSAIVFSTAGVLMGLLINGQPFGIVMVGMGIIALAGIVVNNNIVLIDTYNELRQAGLAPYEAALGAGGLRLRPVLLTAITTVLGLMPMVLEINVNLFAPSLGIGAPSTQWWTQLSSAIAGGLVFATGLTLLLTPCMLVLWQRRPRREAAKPAEA